MSMPELPRVADAAPTDHSVTDYDRARMVTYLRLLDAAAEGAPWEEVCRVVLGIDPAIGRHRARQAYDSHLARAQWLAESGYRDLLHAPD